MDFGFFCYCHYSNTFKKLDFCKNGNRNRAKLGNFGGGGQKFKKGFRRKE